MNTIRSGKIARLPEEVREELNRRLANHESSTPLLAWLNALPEVCEIMAEEFDGKIINRRNLHDWRHGGFAEWQRQEQAGKLMGQLCAEGNGLGKMEAGALMNTMTTFAAARYVVEMKKNHGGNTDKGQGMSWERLREFCGDLVALRRGEQLAARLEWEKERTRYLTEGNRENGGGRFPRL